MNIFSKIESMIEDARPHLHKGVKQADLYACRIIALLEQIAHDDERPEDQRVKRFALTNGAVQTWETPLGPDWQMVALVVEPVGATTITIRLGGVTRFAQQFAAAGTPQVPATIIPAGGELDVLSTGADAVVTIIATLKRPRPKAATGTTGDQLMPGMPGANEYDMDRHFTDEAVEYDTPRRAQNESDEDAMLSQAAPEPATYETAEPIP